MSYCRWSSMNWMCDVYVYEDVSGGWTTHVAGNKRKFPPIPDLMGSQFSMRMFQWSEAYSSEATGYKIVYPKRWKHWVVKCWWWFVSRWHRVHMWQLEHIPRRYHTQPEAAQTYNDPTPGACADRLEYLRSQGFTVPQYAIDALRAEHVDYIEPINPV